MPDGRASTDSPPLLGGSDRTAQLETLRRQIAGAGSPASPEGGLTARLSPFHKLIGGVRPKWLVDLLEVRPGSGASLVGLWLAAHAARRHGELVVIDPERTFYPPAAIIWGVDARRLLLLRPPSLREALAATEIALRSPAVSAVWASLGKIEGRAYRRMLLAAEAGNAFGVFVRDGRHEIDPSWADVQLCLEPIAAPGDPDAPLLVRATQRRNRHGPAGGEATLAVNWRTGDIYDVTDPDAPSVPNPLSVAPRLARAAKPA